MDQCYTMLYLYLLARLSSVMLCSCAFMFGDLVTVSRPVWHARHMDLPPGRWIMTALYCSGTPIPSRRSTNPNLAMLLVNLEKLSGLRSNMFFYYVFLNQLGCQTMSHRLISIIVACF